MDIKFDQKPAEIGGNSSILDTGSAILRENSSAEQDNPAIQALNEDFSIASRENTEKVAENAVFCESKAEKSIEVNEKIEKSTNSLSISDNKDSFFNADSENDLLKAFPSVNVLELKNSANFQSLLALIKSNPSLSTVYSCYNAIITSAEENSKQRLAQALANAKTSVGSLASREESDNVFFTKEQVLKMSPEQIKKNFVKIRQSQEKW